MLQKSFTDSVLRRGPEKTVWLDLSSRHLSLLRSFVSILALLTAASVGHMFGHMLHIHSLAINNASLCTISSVLCFHPFLRDHQDLSIVEKNLFPHLDVICENALRCQENVGSRLN